MYHVTSCFDTNRLSLQIVQEYERAVIFRLGRILGKAKGPGMCLLKISCVVVIHCQGEIFLLLPRV